MKNKVKKLKDLKGVSLQWLADNSGVSRSTIQNVEKFKGSPSLKVCKSIHKALNKPYKGEQFNVEFAAVWNIK